MISATKAAALFSLSCGATVASAFVAPRAPPGLFGHQSTTSRGAASTSSVDTEDAAAPTAASETVRTVTESVSKLKRVLEREYTSFFDPMETQYYSPTVSFDDPMTSLEGVGSYQSNVDMLASRTFLGKWLFEGAGINLHSVTGGQVSNNGKAIEDVVTRWTLRVTAKALPWKPEAVFTGVSIYRLSPGGTEGVIIDGQIDYWDSVNIDPHSGGNYRKVDKGLAVSDFLGQLRPSGLEAKSAADEEVPYVLLRRGDGYDVRMYPSYTVATLPYGRRDEGFGSLGAFSRGMKPLGPAIMEVPDSETSDKRMSWPLTYAPPGTSTPPPPTEAIEKAGDGQWRTITVVTVPSRVVAVRSLKDASAGPVVRKADVELREALERDGLVPADDSEGKVKFAQYDAVFSMGKRRCEVWIDLEEGGHPW